MNTSDNTTETKISQSLAVLFLSMASSRGARTENGELHMIAAQRKQGSQKAAFLNARVIHEFIEIGVAATDYRKRLVMRELLDYLDQHPDVRYVIFPTVGRVSRKLEDFHALTRQFDDRSVVVTFSSGDPVLLRPAAREAIWLTGEWARQQVSRERATRRKAALSRTSTK